MIETFELSITRRIDAPVEAVWRAWTEHLGEWFCPRPWRAEVIELQITPGGRSSFVFHGPAGEAMPLELVYLAVEPMRRIVSTDALDAEWRPREPGLVRIDDFAEEDGGTRYTAIARHWTAEARDRHVAMGFEAGWNAATDQLAEVAQRIAAIG